MRQLKVLIADDHEAVRRGIRSLLSSHSDYILCAEAANGSEAVEKARALHPDLILMDISMPNMDGLEATRVIHNELPETQIFLVSQNDPGLVKKQVARVGAQGFIPKSKLSEDLFGALGPIINQDGIARDRRRSNSLAQPKMDLDFLADSGEMAQRMRTFDWSKTPLGPVAQWPQSLKTSVSICLASRFPIVMYWGPEYVVLYNDAYSTILGSKHPWALGQACRDCWGEIWETIGPMLDGVFTSGQATWSNDLLLMLKRHGYAEECYFSFSFSPVRVETGAVGGVFTAVMETTDSVIGERRLRTLRDLAATAVNAHSEDDAWRISAETLSGNLHDVPFSLMCGVSESDAQVQVLASSGIDAAHPFCRSLCEPQSRLAEEVRLARKSRDMRVIRLSEFWAGDVPQGSWQTTPETALLIPVTSTGQDWTATVLVAALSPHKKLDDTYRTFFQLLAQQITTSVADARWHDEERRQQVLARKELEERDRASSLLAAIVDSSDDAIVSKNLDGIITSWNKAAERLFGYTAQEAIGRHITLIIPQDRHREEEKILSQLRRGERVDHFETVRQKKDGSMVEVSLTISPVRDSKGGVVGASKVARDISDRKRAERELRESEQRLRDLSERLDAEVRSRTKELENRNADVLRQSEMLRVLSRRLLQAQDEQRRHIARELHDSAGQTLTVLGMNVAQLMRKAGKESPQMAEELENIQESVRQLHNEIRTASYLLHPPLLDESGLSSALGWYIDGLAERSGLEMSLGVSEDFGRLPQDLELVVFRVVQESLTNIHRHSESKTASIRLARDADRITVEIQDRGKGISRERLAEIQSRGAGLGISGMRERLRQFGGVMTIDSGPQGTTITVNIPLPADSPAEDSVGVQSARVAV